MKSDATYEVREFKTLTDYQEAVEGPIGLIPHKNKCDAKWTAFANENFLTSQFPTNYAAWSLLAEKLGFCISSLGIWGNVILFGKEEKSLNKKDIEMIKEFYSNLN